MTAKDKIILLFGALSFITACIIYEFNRVGAVYFLGQAIAFVSYATVLYRLHKNIVTEIILMLTIDQLLDELFGNPEVFYVGEFIAFGLYLLYKFNQKYKSIVIEIISLLLTIYLADQLISFISLMQLSIIITITYIIWKIRLRF